MGAKHDDAHDAIAVGLILPAGLSFVFIVSLAAVAGEALLLVFATLPDDLGVAAAAVALDTCRTGTVMPNVALRN